ncbi:MAG: CDP-alcohol phosphatidyltransferase family protein [Candidatus Firestonebacteria bacterium]
MNLANFLTVLRFICIPIFIILYINDSKISLIIFLIAGITDVLDGFVARKFNIETKIGAILDPIADKFLVFSVYLLFYISSVIKPWIFFFIIGRDIAILSGWIIRYLITGKKDIKPSIFGKFTTFFEVSTAIVILTGFANSLVGNILLSIMVLFIILSAIDYLIQGFTT